MFDSLRKMFTYEKVSGKTDGLVILPHQRLGWGKTGVIGAQHVVAMFGATFLVPLLTGFPPSTTLFFSAISTAIFLFVCKNQLPSYMGSSFAFVAPILAITSSSGKGDALFGILITGVLMIAVGVVLHIIGASVIDKLMPPLVTGAIVALIGLNLAPTAWSNFSKAPATALVTLTVIVLVGVLGRGTFRILNILIGVIAGYLFAVAVGEVDFSVVNDAALFGLPDFWAPTINWSVIPMFLPVVLVQVAENVGHLKSVSAMTGENYDHLTGRMLVAGGLGSVFAGLGGGSGTTTYAENIGVMATTKVYSTAAYWFAALTAMILALCPKFGAIISTIPPGVLGGATTLLYGMIGVLGVRIWVENKVDFTNNKNMITAALALITGIANFTFSFGNIQFGGIAIGTAVALVVYHIFNQFEIRANSDHSAKKV
jgi:uracil-xanthine permease